MKKHLFVYFFALSAFSIHADGVNLACAPYQTVCVNCPEYQTLIPIEQFSSDTESLDVEADQSEISQDANYHLTGNVKLKSSSYVLSADDVEFSSSTQSTHAKGNVKFQDSTYLITGKTFAANKQNDDLEAVIDSANYQELESNANGSAASITKTANKVIFRDATYSFCPINQNDWQIRAKTIEANLEKNRGIADHATIVFQGFPIFYFPKYSWVLEGRGSGFLPPDYDTYSDPSKKSDTNYKRSYRLRIPYYFNLAPDRDLILAYTYMSSRGSVIDNRYRQLIDRKLIGDEMKDSMFEIESEYLFRDDITKLKRWLVNATTELDISDKTHISTKYNRVSDAEYFKEIKHSDTDLERLLSHLKVTYKDPENHFSSALLTEDEQIVNAGAPAYTRALEGSISKTFNTKNKLPVTVSLVSTKFTHEAPGKDSGVRTHGNVGVTKTLSTKFPVVTTRANVSNTHYELKNKNNINRTVVGAGMDFAFPFISQSELFNAQVIRTITPKISYNYKAKELQGNIPIFDTEDKYDDIMTFADLTSGERYTGLDRITNANDVTLSFISSWVAVDAEKEDLDLLNFRIAQTFYADDEVVSDTTNTNYETRLSHSDIAAGIDIAVNQFVFNTDIQFNPDTSKIVKRTNGVSYKSNPRKFITLAYNDKGTKTSGTIYGAFPLNDSIHLFGGLDKVFSTGVKNKETAGIAYESCCWATRLVHFKEYNGSTYSYSTGIELVFKGLGSTSSSIRKHVQNNIPYYRADLGE
jgi:LPS-assembly protein